MPPAPVIPYPTGTSAPNTNLGAPSCLPYWLHCQTLPLTLYYFLVIYEAAYPTITMPFTACPYAEFRLVGAYPRHHRQCN